MTFRLLGLDPAPFRHLFGRRDDELRAWGVQRLVVDAQRGFPDRIEVRDATPGDTVLLLNHVHQPADTPYRASHAIFVREHAEVRCDMVDTVPDALRRRTISLRAFSHEHDMVDAVLCEGTALDAPIADLLARHEVAYLHAHYATRGCYAARVERA